MKLSIHFATYPNNIQQPLVNMVPQINVNLAPMWGIYNSGKLNIE